MNAIAGPWLFGPRRAYGRDLVRPGTNRAPASKDRRGGDSLGFTGTGEWG
jgi:hypothetical protein